MKPGKNLLLPMAIGLAIFTFDASADDPAPAQGATREASQYQQEYERRLSEAGSEQEREAIREQYRQLEQERIRESETAAPCGNRGDAKAKGSGKPCVDGKSGAGQRGYGDGADVPAGSKNRPQKSGK